MNLRPNILVFTLLAVVALPGCAMTDTSESQLNQWIAHTLKSIESVPEDMRYQTFIKHIASDTTPLSSLLRDAASGSLKRTGLEAKRSLLLGAAPHFSKSCMPADPTIAANKLLHICFEKEWPHAEFSGMLAHVDATSYLFVRALKKEFETAGVYTDEARRLLATFLRSNAVLREKGK